MIDLLELPLGELKTWLTSRGLPGYRADQVWAWLFRHRAEDFRRMTDLPEALREQLTQEFRIWTARPTAQRVAGDGTEKLLLELSDGHRIECVLLRDAGGHRTICISTQVGCAMGCVFCASGLDGVVRNLTSGEIVEQMLYLQRALPPEERVTHLVVMGSGEPLANLDGLLPALDVATDRHGLGIGARRITISTVGLPKAIRRLAHEDCGYHLAVSLHAPDDELRNRLIPTNRKVGVAAILDAADYYFQVTGRRVTFEYVLLSGVNDGRDNARRLAARLRGRRALVNLIPYNPVADLAYRTPAASVTATFAQILRQGGVNVKIRFRKGDRIDAACGQLRRSCGAAGSQAR